MLHFQELHKMCLKCEMYGIEMPRKTVLLTDKQGIAVIRESVHRVDA